MEDICSPVDLSWVWLCPLGNIWPCLETFLVVITGACQLTSSECRSGILTHDAQGSPRPSNKELYDPKCQQCQGWETDLIPLHGMWKLKFWEVKCYQFTHWQVGEPDPEFRLPSAQFWVFWTTLFFLLIYKWTIHLYKNMRYVRNI